MCLFNYIFHLPFPWTIHMHVAGLKPLWFDREGTRRVLESWYKLNARIRGSHVRLDLHVSDHIPLMDVGSVLELYMKNPSYSSPCLHFCDSSCRASGWIWFLIPPKTLEVASVATMSGLTTAGGSWRRTPPTAPVIPRCSCSLVAVS